jgi:hypothetical protein
VRRRKCRLVSRLCLFGSKFGTLAIEEEESLFIFYNWDSAFSVLRRQALEIRRSEER